MEKNVLMFANLKKETPLRNWYQGERQDNFINSLILKRKCIAINPGFLNASLFCIRQHYKTNLPKVE